MRELRRGEGKCPKHHGEFEAGVGPEPSFLTLIVACLPLNCMGHCCVTLSYPVAWFEVNAPVWLVLSPHLPE